MTASWEDIAVRQDGIEKTPCDCCGKTSLTLKGDLLHTTEWIGSYWVRLAEGHPESLPLFSIGFGDWSEDSAASTRWVAALEYSKEHEGFRAIDQGTKSATATFLDRDDWIGTDVAEHIVAMTDAIFMKDERLAELHP